jgi:DMSO/TMAO reductase YedYZ molybdopterin-dependent catalytic subunit
MSATGLFGALMTDADAKVTRSSTGRGERLVGALIGVIVTGVALGVGRLVAGLVAEPAFPVVAVGQSTVDAAPQWLRSFAIRTFGTNDKGVLVVGIVVVLTVASAVLGMAAVRRPRVGYVALGVLGVLGVVAALSRPGSDPSWALPSLAAALAGAAAFGALLSAVGVRDPMGGSDGSRDADPRARVDRRRFLWTALGLGAVAVVAAQLGSFLSDRRLALASRASTRVPTPTSPAPTLPAGAELHVPGLGPFFTPNGDFYRVDTALFVPQVRAEEWRLRIHGMVEREVEIDFGRLLARPMIERDITLNCVSNPVGGPYVGNARWIGTPLAPLLEEAGVGSGAEQIVSRSIDGMTIGTPTAIALDGRDSMLAVAMNGEPLPLEHGFPVRMLVPGLYGYESATKWVVDLELTTFAAYDAYWVQRGWAQVAEIQTMSRIDRPREGGSVRAGTVPVAGVAWAQHRGIERVEVRVDGGPWNEAELSALDTIDTWRQWVWSWEASAGDHVLEARATDETGAVQTSSEAQPFPSGATGWHRVRVSVA